MTKDALQSLALDIENVCLSFRSKASPKPEDTQDFIYALKRLSGKASMMDVEDVKVPERDIRTCFSGLGTRQAVIDFCALHHITLPKNEYWYCINANGRTAWIEGLEASKRAHGIPRITNGVVVWMELADGTLFLGHRDWLKYDRRTANLQKEHEKEQTKKSNDFMNNLDPKILALL
jgi:hypothetical protein